MDRASPWPASVKRATDWVTMVGSMKLTHQRMVCGKFRFMTDCVISEAEMVLHTQVQLS